MGTYRRILVAIDLTDEAPQVLERAEVIRTNHDAEIYLLHVVEPIGYAYGGDIPMDLTELQSQLDKSARRQLNDYGLRYNVPEARQLVAIGRPSTEVHKAAEEHEADLIIVGSHGRHGIQLLLGSTATGILHGASCDVLAVRIQ